ncbi:hypothetical protein CLU83_1348 [Flavobacterium sp. 1]|nr:hypothetical protein CLU83_1348 [Flavobacterium sp. 1]
MLITKLYFVSLFGNFIINRLAKFTLITRTVQDAKAK